MNDTNTRPCGCNPCPGTSCNCGCQKTAAQSACACGPACRCGSTCTCAKRTA